MLLISSSKCLHKSNNQIHFDTSQRGLIIGCVLFLLIYFLPVDGLVAGKWGGGVLISDSLWHSQFFKQ